MEPKGSVPPVPKFEVPKFERVHVGNGVTIVKVPARTDANYFDKSGLYPSECVTTVTPKQVAPPPPRPEQ